MLWNVLQYAVRLEALPRPSQSYFCATIKFILFHPAVPAAFGGFIKRR